MSIPFTAMTCLLLQLTPTLLPEVGFEGKVRAALCCICIVLHMHTPYTDWRHLSLFQTQTGTRIRDMKHLIGKSAPGKSSVNFWYFLNSVILYGIILAFNFRSKRKHFGFCGPSTHNWILKLTLVAISNWLSCLCSRLFLVFGIPVQKQEFASRQ